MEEREGRELPPGDGELTTVGTRLQAVVHEGVNVWDTFVNKTETVRANSRWSLARMTVILSTPSLQKCIELKDVFKEALRDLRVRGRPLQVALDCAKWRKPFRRAAAIMHGVLQELGVRKDAKSMAPWPKDETGILRVKVRCNTGNDQEARTLGTFSAAEGAWRLIEENIRHCFSLTKDDFEQKLKDKERRPLK